MISVGVSGIPAFSLDLDGRPGSARTARRVTMRFLAGLGDGAGPGPAEDTRQDVVLVVSELVGNACRHAPGPCRLTVSVTGSGTVEVAVEDTSPRLPEPRRVPEPAGYGLRVVNGLSRGFRVVPTGTGKIVHATVAER
ncbi:hypothetical protein GCM10010193_27080 [Kitasatospora atroaurantiaca]|uniref:Histidine kinase-like protein n=1 Tax=Kitasatospora atroaurantiaca TaxID=285545 RepID=A0A561EK43_9ACTN|nr:ATP-binding protein [Kitasatospora atroaurantiaca]TWE15969.1 histidine kinase-like protein [Kitasatospora atroaurantiaca]